MAHRHHAAPRRAGRRLTFVSYGAIYDETLALSSIGTTFVFANRDASNDLACRLASALNRQLRHRRIGLRLARPKEAR